jgi:hypothetical protein
MDFRLLLRPGSRAFIGILGVASLLVNIDYSVNTLRLREAAAGHT